MDTSKVKGLAKPPPSQLPEPELIKFDGRMVRWDGVEAFCDCPNVIFYPGARMEWCEHIFGCFANRLDLVGRDPNRTESIGIPITRKPPYFVSVVLGPQDGQGMRAVMMTSDNKARFPMTEIGFVPNRTVSRADIREMIFPYFVEWAMTKHCEGMCPGGVFPSQDEVRRAGASVVMAQLLTLVVDALSIEGSDRKCCRKCSSMMALVPDI